MFLPPNKLTNKSPCFFDGSFLWSRKLNGHRAVFTNDLQLLSRNARNLNHLLPENFSFKMPLEFLVLEGELVAKTKNGEDGFKELSSAAARPRFRPPPSITIEFHIFDAMTKDPTIPFLDRYRLFLQRFKNNKFFKVIEQHAFECKSQDGIVETLFPKLTPTDEGIIVRDAYATYEKPRMFKMLKVSKPWHKLVTITKILQSDKVQLSDGTIAKVPIRLKKDLAALGNSVKGAVLDSRLNYIASLGTKWV